MSSRRQVVLCATFGVLMASSLSLLTYEWRYGKVEGRTLIVPFLSAIGWLLLKFDVESDSNINHLRHDQWIMLGFVTLGMVTVLLLGLENGDLLWGSIAGMMGVSIVGVLLYRWHR